MLNLNLNLDESQKVQFSSVDALKNSVLKNPFRYDGLCLMEDGVVLVDLAFVECYQQWEVEVNTFANEGGSFESLPCDSLAEAVAEFVSELQVWGVW